MDLTTTLFDIKSLRKKHAFVSFNEGGVKLTMLSPINSEINSGHRYMFGTYKDEKFYWLFSGKSIANTRELMREIFFEIKEKVTDKKQIIFVYKGNIYGSRI